MAKLNDYLKTAIFFFILLQIAPPILHNMKKQWDKNLEPYNKVGCISIHGNITSSTQYSKYIKQYFKDPSIKALLLRIESPGGASGTCQALYHEIEELKKEYPKPIITYSENICASGAYYVASATDHIVTTGSAIIGSIGAQLAPIFSIKDLLQDWKINCDTIAAGKYKDTFNPYAQHSPEQTAMLQSIAHDSYQQFARDVASKRHLQINKIDQWADGKLFTGQQAYDVKLVDSLGSLTTAIKLIKKNMIPSNRKIEWIKPPSKTGWQRFLALPDDISTSQATSSFLSMLLEKFTTFLQTNNL